MEKACSVYHWRGLVGSPVMAVYLEYCIPLDGGKSTSGHPLQWE